MAEESDKPTVLVVEDEQALVELYVRWLGGDYEVRTASSGREALEALDGDVDVVLLDRLMPGMGGDEVLAEIQERDVDPKVTMVTAVEPDFDVITMGFDDYLTKPVERDELLETVHRLLSRSEFADLEQELYALVAKQSALESTKPDEELAASEEYADLQARIAELESRLDAALPGMESDEFVAMIRDIDDDRPDDLEAAAKADGPCDGDGEGDGSGGGVG